MKLLYFFLLLTLVASDDSQDFTIGSRLFTGDVYSQILRDNKENILVSPFSAEIIFALTQSGAQGATGEELRSTLHLPTTKEAVDHQIKTVLPTIHSDFVSLTTANKIYVANNFVVKDSFQKLAKDVYEAEFQNIEFAESQAAADSINQWIEDQTNGKIKKLLEAIDLDATTRVVLVNALYFQGNWSVPFDPHATTKTKFFKSEEASVETPMMYKESEIYNYYESEELDAQFLEIPFQGGEATMTFVLPRKTEGIAVLEKKIRSVLTTPKLTQEYVEVRLPKFKIESFINFKDVLSELGVEKAFDYTEADFTGIGGEKGDFFITHSKQKTYIDVNEIGVEAAAATDIGNNEIAPPPATKSFIADHPFMFYIKVHDIILFEGRVLVPEQ